MRSLAFAILALLVSAPVFAVSPRTPPSLDRLEARNASKSEHSHSDPTKPVGAPSLHGWNIDVVDVVESGRCLTTLISDPIVYATFAATLVAIDVSDPQSPTRVGYALLSGNCWDMALKGNYLYCQTSLSRRVDIVDVSDPTSPVIIGSAASDGYALAVDGNYLYAEFGAGFRIYDVSTPTSPIMIGSIASGMGGSMIARDGYLYTALFSGGLRVFDVANPESPTILSTLPTGFGAQGLDVDGSHAYLVNFLNPGAGLHVVDISNPAAPAAVGFFNAPNSGYLDVEVEQGHAYVVDNYGTLEVFDISNPTAPIHNSTTQLCSLFDPWAVDVSNGIATVGGGYPAMCIVDISDTSEPVSLASYDALRPIYSLDVAPAHLAFPWDLAGVLMLNRYNTSQRHFGSGGGYYLDGTDIVVRDGHAYLASCESSYSEWGSLSVFDISDPTNPMKIGSCELEDCIFEFGIGQNHIYATTTRGLVAIDISNPTLPSIVGQLTMSAWDIDVAEPYVYLAMPNDGLRVVDVSIPSAPVVVGTDLPLAGDPRGISVMNGYAFVGAGGSSGGLRIVDISNAQQPLLVGSFDASGNGMVVSARDQYVYFATSGFLRVLDVSAPTTPVEVASIAIGGLVANLTFAPPYVYGVQYVDGASSGPLLKFQTPLLTAVPNERASQLVLGQNYPNPFNPATTINFELPSRSHALVEIFDVRGRLVRTLVDEILPAGQRSVSWDGKGENGGTIQSGVYFYRLTSQGRSQAKKMIILK